MKLHLKVSERRNNSLLKIPLTLTSSGGFFSACDDGDYLCPRGPPRPSIISPPCGRDDSRVSSFAFTSGYLARMVSILDFSSVRSASCLVRYSVRIASIAALSVSETLARRVAISLLPFHFPILFI